MSGNQDGLPALDTAFIGFTCPVCGATADNVAPGIPCAACQRRGVLANWEAVYDPAAARRAWQARAGRGVWRYAGLLPIGSVDARIDLGAGATALLPWSSPDADGPRVWLKNETTNPTWSYKDRLAAVGVSAAREAGARVVAASSSGNHGAATAAAAAAGGLACVVFVRPSVGAQTVDFIRSLGASVYATEGTGRWAWVGHGTREHGWYPLSTHTGEVVGSPHGVEGYKSLAFEVFEQLGRTPSVVVVPTCYGEGLAGTWAGFAQLVQLGVADRMPRMVAVEPAGGAPLARTLQQGLDRVATVPSFSTVATSIAATSAAARALRALQASDGVAVRVRDDEILAARAALGRRGVYAEPAACAGLAAVPSLPEALSGVRAGDDVVVLVTAGGLRAAGDAGSGAGTAPLLPEDPRESDVQVHAEVLARHTEALS